MDIAHISHCYKPVIGGQEVYISNLQQVTAAAGHRGVVFQPDRGVRDADVVPVLRLRGLPRLVRGSEPHLFDLALHLTRRRQLARYDVIIAHYALHARRLDRFAERTIVLSHGVEWHLDRQAWHDRRRAAAARRCFGRFAHVVNDTHYLRTLGMDIEPGARFFEEVAERKWFIPNCVDTARFAPGDPHPSLDGRRVVLVPRQMTPDRGIDLAIRTMRLLADGDSELEMCLLGKRRPGAYGEMLVRLIAELDLESKVYFAEDVPNHDMPAWYNGAAATLIPTLRREGTSLSALESMACGTPTVSTNVAGLADLPTVQAAPDDEALAAALGEALADRDAIAARQREAVRTTFNLDNWGRAWLRAIEAVGGGGRSS